MKREGSFKKIVVYNHDLLHNIDNISPYKALYLGNLKLVKGLCCDTIIPAGMRIGCCGILISV